MPTSSQFAGIADRQPVGADFGKFAVVDLFDTNRYANSPKSDFLNWTTVNAGTFDYAGDAWAYTYGRPPSGTRETGHFAAGFLTCRQIPSGGGAPTAP